MTLPQLVIWILGAVGMTVLIVLDVRGRRGT